MQTRVISAELARRKDPPTPTPAPVRPGCGRAVDDPAKLARAAMIVRAALARAHQARDAGTATDEA